MTKARRFAVTLSSDASVNGKPDVSKRVPHIIPSGIYVSPDGVRLFTEFNRAVRESVRGRISVAQLFHG